MQTPRDSRRIRPPIKATHQAKKPSGKRGRAGTPQQGKKPRVAKKSRSRGGLAILGAIAALMATGGLVVGGIWLAILLMINPDSVVWLNQFLPEWTRIPVAEVSPPQTLAEIRQEAQKTGLMAGEPQFLNTDLLLPIWASLPNCQTDCEQVVELRIYKPDQLRGQEQSYRLFTQLSIVGPEEYFVLSAPVSTDSEDAGSSRSLPLTEFSRFDDKAPGDGFWFNLSGQRVTSGTPMAYGQVIHYNPDQTHLSVMLQWTSPEQRQPYWQEVTGGSTPEFIVNQTVGLEPHFKVYQLKPREFVPNPIYLEEISLAQPAIDTPVYRNALLLARNGLWSPALKLLKSQKNKKWSIEAEAQMAAIQLHAQVTEAQAKGAWASPSQQIFAHLLDGRWTDALQVFQMAEVGAPIQEIAALLKSDSGALWNRVDAALKVNPKDEQVQAWGALILAAQQGRGKAIAWLKQRSPVATLASTQETLTQEASAIPIWIYPLLNHLEATSAISPVMSQIVGHAQLIKTVNPKEW
ncbi:MAG: hypothetical protein LDL41_16070, partial [Coleofasciculus sp. S288]|nr:hypothetical protein [Coleofasciculus sp. S288]